MHVRDVLSGKSSLVHTCSPDDTLADVADLMVGHNVGSLIVMQDEEMVGIITERDILRRVVAAERNPSLTPIRDVMTAPVACCKPETTLLECRSVMTDKRIRHLPVVDEHGLRGIVTIGDLMAQEVGEHQATVEYLSSYIFGTSR